MNIYLFLDRVDMAKRRIIRLFECWQSDDKKTRDFIRKALRKVSKRINEDEELQYAIEIDRDTQNILGSVDIQKVIGIFFIQYTMINILLR